MWAIAYIGFSLPAGWLFFQQPKGSVHFDRLGLMEVWLWGLLWPLILLLIIGTATAKKLRRKECRLTLSKR